MLYVVLMDTYDEVCWLCVETCAYGIDLSFCCFCPLYWFSGWSAGFSITRVLRVAGTERYLLLVGMTGWRLASRCWKKRLRLTASLDDLALHVGKALQRVRVMFERLLGRFPGFTGNVRSNVVWQHWMLVGFIGLVWSGGGCCFWQRFC